MQQQYISGECPRTARHACLLTNTIATREKLVTAKLTVRLNKAVSLVTADGHVSLANQK